MLRKKEKGKRIGRGWIFIERGYLGIRESGTRVLGYQGQGN